MAARKTSSVSATEKAMPSQKASTASARPASCRRRQGLLADEADVVGAAVPVVRREGVGAEKGRADIDRPVPAKLPRHPQHFQFGVDIKPIARLYLDGRNAFRKQGIESL